MFWMHTGYGYPGVDTYPAQIIFLTLDLILKFS